MNMRVRNYNNSITVDTPRSDHSILWIADSCLNLGYWRNSKVKVVGIDLVECYGL